MCMSYGPPYCCYRRQALMLLSFGPIPGSASYLPSQAVLRHHTIFPIHPPERKKDVPDISQRLVFKQMIVKDQEAPSVEII